MGARSGVSGTGGSDASGNLTSGTANNASGMGTTSTATSSGVTDGGTGGAGGGTGGTMQSNSTGGGNGGGSSDTSDTSDTSDADSGTSTTTSDTTTASATSSSSTGGVVITGELPWLDDFESYPVGGQADPNWTAIESDGNWSIVSDGPTQLYAPNSEASNRNMTYAGDPSWTNLRLQVDVRLGDINDSGTRIYIAVRAAPAGSKLDYYHAYLRADGRVRLGKYVGGSTDETFSEARDTGVALDETTWHTFALTVMGDTLSVELDGVEVDSASTTGLSSGTIALGVDGGTAEFDNVGVTEP